MRYFSPEEADALIPELEKIFEAVAELTAQAEVKASLLRRRAEAGVGAAAADSAAMAIERSQLQFLAQGVNEWMQKIVDLGAMPKGVDPALVDFPGKVDGREVYLCWKLGEKKIAHYHGVEEGFSTRRPLPRRR